MKQNKKPIKLVPKSVGDGLKFYSLEFIKGVWNGMGIPQKDLRKKIKD